MRRRVMTLSALSLESDLLGIYICLNHRMLLVSLVCFVYHSV